MSSMIKGIMAQDWFFIKIFFVLSTNFLFYVHQKSGTVDRGMDKKDK